MRGVGRWGVMIDSQYNVVSVCGVGVGCRVSRC